MTTRLADLNPDTVGTDLELSGRSMLQRMGTDVVIASKADLEQVVMDRTIIADAERSVVSFFEPLKKMAHGLHAALCDRERAVLGPLRVLDAARHKAITEFKHREDDERRAREQALADQQRRDEQARATVEAASLEMAGHRELADAILEDAIAAPAPVVSLPDVTSQVSGLKFRKYFRWRYAGGPKDVATTPNAIVVRTMSIIPREFLVVDEKKISAYVKAMKTAGKIPGIEIYETSEPVR